MPNRGQPQPLATLDRNQSRMTWHASALGAAAVPSSRLAAARADALLGFTQPHADVVDDLLERQPHCGGGTSCLPDTHWVSGTHPVRLPLPLATLA
jgi:hypothetical protein